MSPQQQFTLRAKDSTEERSYSNQANDGFEFCRALCHETKADECVGHQWVEETKKYDFFFDQKSRASEYNFRCVYWITTAKGLLPGSKAVFKADDCLQECKKTKDCIQWHWQHNILTIYKWVGSNMVMHYSTPIIVADCFENGIL